MTPLKTGSRLFRNLAGLLISCGLLSGCNLYPYLEYQAPQDEILEACNNPATDPMDLSHTLPAPKSPGVGNRTPFTCEGFWKPGAMQTALPVASTVAGAFGASADPDGQFYRIQSSKPDAYIGDPKPGLVVLIEPGTVDGNRKLWTDYGKGSSFGPLIVDATFPAQLKPHFRTFISNFTFAFLKKTFEDAPKQVYGHVYFVKGDADLKVVFLRTLQKALLSHPKVDLFLVGNGVPGVYIMHRDMDPEGAGALTAPDLIKWAQTINSIYPQLTYKVRSIFQTHAWTLAALPHPPPEDLSMYQAYEKSFPMAKFYGNYQHNIYPLYRDFVMFEFYYKDPSLDYKSAYLTTIQFMQKKADGSFRSQLAFPAVQGMGCIYLFNSNLAGSGSGRYCKPMFQEPFKYSVDLKDYLASVPHM